MRDVTIKLENVSSTEIIWLRKMLMGEISDCQDDIEKIEFWIKDAKDKKAVLSYQANIQLLKDHIEALTTIKKALEE